MVDCVGPPLFQDLAEGLMGVVCLLVVQCHGLLCGSTSP